MRTIHADLLTAQHSGTLHDPYIHLNINSTDYSSRLLALEHREEPYLDSAEIVLANSDRHFNDIDLRGKSFSIGYGYVTSSGNRYCGDANGSDGTPTLWVKSQELVSMEGDLVCILNCEGGWARLEEYNVIPSGDPPYFNQPFTTVNTVFEIIEAALIEGGFTLNALATSDGIIDSFNPIFTVNPLSYETIRHIVWRLICMTKSYIRQVEGSAFEIVFPQEDDDIDETYYSNISPQFREYREKKNLLVPNFIAVFCNQDLLTGDWNTPEHPIITGTYQDDESIADYGKVTEYNIAPFIDNQTDADNRAEAILSRYRAETKSGKLVLPFHDCRVEMYDRVSIYDLRGT